VQKGPIGVKTLPTKRNEGLKVARFMMVLSSLSPLFILWAVRGIPALPDLYLWTACAILVILPNAVLLSRVKIAKTRGDVVTLTVDHADDHRDHLLVYLFAMLLPLYDLNFGERRDLFAAIIAVSFIVFLFYNLHMYYMNLAFAFLGYRVFTVYPSTDGGLSRVDKVVLLTWRPYFRPSQEVDALRISNSVYFESRKN